MLLHVQEDSLALSKIKIRQGKQMGLFGLMSAGNDTWSLLSRFDLMELVKSIVPSGKIVM